jgi:membrane associated rhomboid family serine protease
MTLTLIVLNVLIYAVEMTTLDPEAMITSYSMLPSDAEHVHWAMTLVTSLFLHADIVHLLGNMYFLWIVGDNVEDILGPARYLAAYLLVGIAAGVAMSVGSAAPEIPTIGASGAISGIAAIYAVLFRKSKLTFMFVAWQVKLETPLWMFVWVLFNLGGLAAGSEGVAWESHLGGFACGLVVGLLSYRPLLARSPLLRLLNDVRA